MASLLRERTDEELEWFLFFSIAVAGKTGLIVEQAVERFFQFAHERPFEYIRQLMADGWYTAALRAARVGQYTKMNRAMRHIIQSGLNPRTCTLDELEAVPGIGPKTARFFLLYTRPGQRVAALDIHILRFLRRIGVDAPDNTPQNPKTYRRLEKAFLDAADGLEMTPAELDDVLWRGSSYKPKAPVAQLAEPGLLKS